MPDQVTARIQAALMAEAARPALATAGARPGAPQPAEPARRQSRHAAGRAGGSRRWRLPELRSQLAVRALGVATAAAVIAGGAYGISQLGPAGQTATSSSAAGGSGAAGNAAVPRPARVSGPVLHYRQAGQAVTFTPVSTRTNFTQQQLTSQAAAALRHPVRSPPQFHGPAISNRPGAHSAPAVHGQSGQSFRGIPVGALQGCVTRVSAGRTVLLVDVGRYQGRPATVIVVAGPAGGTGGSRVFVVGPGCSSSESNLIAQASLPAAG